MKKSILVEVKEGEHTTYENKRAKIEFYIISLWLLFLLTIIITIDIPISFERGSAFIGFKELLTRNTIPLIALFFLFYGVSLSMKYKYKFKGTMNLPVKIKKIKNIDYEHLTFLTTYIVPLIGLDIKQARYFFVLVLLIIIIGWIYIRTDLFYANPTLALLGYYIYEVETNNPNCPKSVFISDGKLFEGQSVQYIQLDNKIFYVGGVN